MDDLCERYTRLYLGIVYDAMRFDLELARPFVLDRAIKPLWNAGPGEAMFGHAFTCRGELVGDAARLDDSARLRIFERFVPGCVQVIDTGGDDTVAHFGDISAQIARAFGAVGAVIDGYTRDARILAADRFPVFCRGTQPQDAYGRWQIVGYEEPVILGGAEGSVRVEPGDWIFADPDGVVVIPAHLGQEVCRLAERRLERENEIRHALVETHDVEELYEQIGRR